MWKEVKGQEREEGKRRMEACLGQILEDFWRNGELEALIAVT